MSPEEINQQPKRKISNLTKMTIAAIVSLFGIIAALLAFSNISEPEEAVKVEKDIGTFSKDVVLGEYVYNDLNTLPSVQIIVGKDGNSGYNFNLVTSNFEFTPSKTSFEHVDGEGHAYLFINGKRERRLYSDWFHVESLTAGDEVAVTLNTNDNKVYTFNDQIVGANTRIGSTVEF